MLYKHKCSPVFDARPRLHVIHNNVEKVTLDVGGSTESAFVYKLNIQKLSQTPFTKGVTTQRVYKVNNDVGWFWT